MYIQEKVHEFDDGSSEHKLRHAPPSVYILKTRHLTV